MSIRSEIGLYYFSTKVLKPYFQLLTLVENESKIHQPTLFTLIQTKFN